MDIKITRNCILISFLLCLLLFSCTQSNNNRKPIRTIAYVGRFTDKNAEKQPDNRFDRMHEYTLKAYIDELNSKDNPVQFELKTFDCKRDSLESALVYQQIAADTSIVSVVDNTWGNHIIGAREIIKSNGIPIIAMNADHNFADFGTQAVFTGNNDYLPSEIISFTTKVLAKKEVVFISEEDYSLHNSFLQEFARKGIKVINLRFSYYIFQPVHET